MKLSRLTLKRFRNVAEETLEPDPGINFLVGSNGQGKTSFLEAIGYLSGLRSFRGAKTEEVIQHGLADGEVRADLREGDWSVQLRVSFAREGGPGGRSQKLAWIDGKPFRSSAQYLSQRFGSAELGFHSVIFNPSDHDLIRGEPSERRDYLDRVIAAEHVELLEALTRYRRLLEQRNAILREAQPGMQRLLEDFTAPMAELAARILLGRLEWVERVNRELHDRARRIAPNTPVLELKYRVVLPGKKEAFLKGIQEVDSGHFAGLSGPATIENLKPWWSDQWRSVGEAERRAGVTLIGPHRDDWAIYQGGTSLKGSGSQGEVRTALLALKIGEIDLFRERTGQRPVLLLDDFSSELDRERRAYLLEYLTGTDLQVFVTSTEESPVPGKEFRIEGGKIK